MNSGDIREHMMVYARAARGMGSGAPGVHVGTVDGVEGNFIKLTKNDSPDGQHHWIPLSWVERVDGRAVYLSKTPDEFRQGAMTQNPDADVAGGSAFGAGSAAGIEQIGRPAPGRDADLSGNAPGSGGVTVGNLPGGQPAPSTTMLGDPGPGGTMDDGNGGTESPTGTGRSISGDNGTAGMDPGGRGNMNPASETGNLGGTMAPHSGEGEYFSAGARPGLLSGGNLTSSGNLESGSLESISGDANGATNSGASANSGLGADAGGVGDSALSSAGGSMLSDRDIAVTGEQSPMGDRDTTDLEGDRQVDRIVAGYESEQAAARDPNAGEYAADKDVSSGTGNTTADRKLMSGAGGASGDFDDRNAHTGASGNVSDPNGLPGQGTLDDASGNDTNGKRGNE